MSPSAPASPDFRVLSWNVNGIRAAVNKGLMASLKRLQPTVAGLQEVRAQREQFPPALLRSRTYTVSVQAAERPGYSGVALLQRRAADDIDARLEVPEFDLEGRFQLARFGALYIANVYFPNGSGKERDNSRVPYKLAFYRRVFERLAPHADAGAPVLVMGDFNTAHQELDLARPKQNATTSGFLPDERAELDRWLRSGWVDTFRHFESGGGHYTWWSQRVGVRERNVGWRIDYVLASPGAMPFLRAAQIHPSVLGSDHCPISVDLDPAVLGH